MKVLIDYMCIFIFCASFGWLLEVLYRSAKSKRLINPGFLVGCCLPIYGCGGVALYALCSIDLSFIGIKFLRILALMLTATMVMTVIELVAGLISVNKYHNRLWDYSNRRFNYKGIICLRFSLIWGVICVFFYYAVFPWLGNAANYIGGTTWGILLVGIYYGVLSVDMVYSLNLMDKIKKYAVSIKETLDFEKFKQKVREDAKRRKQKGYAFMFRINAQINKFIDVENIKDKIDKKL